MKTASLVKMSLAGSATGLFLCQQAFSLAEGLGLALTFAQFVLKLFDQLGLFLYNFCLFSKNSSSAIRASNFLQFSQGVSIFPFSTPTALFLPKVLRYAKHVLFEQQIWLA